MLCQLKRRENGRKNVYRDKQPTTNVMWMFLDVKCLRKGNNGSNINEVKEPFQIFSFFL